MNRENTIRGTVGRAARGTVPHRPLFRDAVPAFKGLGGGKKHPSNPVSPEAVQRVLRKTNYPYGAKSTQALGKQRE